MVSLMPGRHSVSFPFSKGSLSTSSFSSSSISSRALSRNWPVEHPFFKGIPFSRVPLSKGRVVVEGCGSPFSRVLVPFFKGCV